MEGRNCGWWAEGVDWLKKKMAGAAPVSTNPKKNNNNKQNSG